MTRYIQHINPPTKLVVTTQAKNDFEVVLQHEYQGDGVRFKIKNGNGEHSIELNDRSQLPDKVDDIVEHITLCGKFL